MKSLVMFFALFFTLFVPRVAPAAPICAWDHCPEGIENPIWNGLNELQGCSGFYYEAGCANGYKVMTCNSCQSGYIKAKGTLETQSCIFEYQYCKSNCTTLPCSACDASTGYAMCGVNVESEQYGGNCKFNDCDSYGMCSGRQTRYRCTKGYYGNPTSCAQDQCTPCSNSHPSATTVAAGAKLISECYVPTGTVGSDSSGTFEYTSNCYYSG